MADRVVDERGVEGLEDQEEEGKAFEDAAGSPEGGVDPFDLPSDADEEEGEPEDGAPAAEAAPKAKPKGRDPFARSADWGSDDLEYWRGQLRRVLEREQKATGRVGSLINENNGLKERLAAAEERAAKAEAAAPGPVNEFLNSDVMKQLRDGDEVAAKAFEALAQMVAAQGGGGAAAPAAQPSAEVRDLVEDRYNRELEALHPGASELRVTPEFAEYVKAAQDRNDPNLALAASGNPVDGAAFMRIFESSLGEAEAAPAAEEEAKPDPAVNQRVSGLGVRGVRPAGAGRGAPTRGVAKPLDTMTEEEAFQASLEGRI